MLIFHSRSGFGATLLMAGALVLYSGAAPVEAETIILLAAFSQPDTSPRATMPDMALELNVPNTTPSLTMPVE